MDTENTNHADWNKEAIYDAEFSPLITQLIALAKKHQMPMLLSVNYARSGEDNADCTTFIFTDQVRPPEGFIRARREIRRNPNFMAFTIITTKDES